MPNKELEEFFDLKPMTDESTNSTELENIPASTPTVIQDTLDDLVLVKPEEVRENYDISRGTLVRASTVGCELLDQISKSINCTIPELGSSPNVRLYETAGILMRALTSNAQALSTLHQGAGNVLGDVKKVEIDNSQRVINTSASDLQEAVKLFKKRD